MLRKCNTTSISVYGIVVVLTVSFYRYSQLLHVTNINVDTSLSSQSAGSNPTRKNELHDESARRFSSMDRPEARRMTLRNGLIRRNPGEPHRFTKYDRQGDLRYYPPELYGDKPRVVLGWSHSNATALEQLVHSHRNVESLSSGNYPPKTVFPFPFERPYFEECTPMEHWQTHHYPTCNLVHEIDQHAMTLLSARGSWRTVWETLSYTQSKSSNNDENNEAEAVLKMLRLDREFDDESFAYHQVDAMAMERLTASPRIISAFGFCGQSVVTEVARGAVRALVKSSALDSRDRLRMARDLAMGLNDIHSLDYGKGRNATLMHNDINIANMAHDSRGRIMYNDFNLAVLMRWNGTKPCGYPVRFSGYLWRSPEEIWNATYVSEKADVYALGNVLFQVMTKHQPWTWLEPKGQLRLEEVAKRKLQGQQPFFPKEYSESTDIAIRTLYEGIQACYREDPNQRPTAYKLAKGFHQVLEWIRTDAKEFHDNDTAILKELFQS